MTDINLGEIVATTLRNREKELADNITEHNALLFRLEEKGQFKSTNGGRTIVEPLIHDTNLRDTSNNPVGNFKWYEGYEAFDVVPLDTIDAAEYDWKQAATWVSISGIEQIKNSDKHAAQNLIEARIKAAKADMRNAVAEALYSDGTNSKEFGGLQFIVQDDPTSAGTVGGINQATAANSWWRNQTSGSQTITSANVNTYMNDMYLDTLRGTDQVDLILADKSLYKAYWEYLQPLQRFQDAKMAEAGFRAVQFQGADVVYDAQCPDKRMYFLNTDYLYFRTAPGRRFAVEKERQIQNADYVIVPIFLAGNLTCCNRERQGVIIDD